MTKPRPTNPRESMPSLGAWLDVLNRPGGLLPDWEPTAEELADALWLAAHRPVAWEPARPRMDRTARDKVGDDDPPEPSRDPGPSSRPDGGSSSNEGSQLFPRTAQSMPVEGLTEAELAEMDQGRDEPGREAEIPLPNALPRALEFARALKPLKRRVPSRSRFLLDEDATADRIAESIALGASWTPVWKPRRERWLELALVIDRTRSMLVWRPMIEAFTRLLVHLGAFRDVRVWRIDTERDAPARLLRGAANPAGEESVADPGELVDPSGRRLILVLTDGVTLGWRHGWAAEVLQRWGKVGPLAIAQLLPEEFWPNTQLGDATVNLHAWSPGVANGALRVRAPRGGWTTVEFPALPVPLVGLTPEDLRLWARLVAGVHERRALGLVLEPSRGRRRGGSDTDRPATPEAWVERFQDNASEEAWRLATHLAVVSPFTIPIARLLMRAVLEQETPAPLAEVMLSGLVRVAPHPPDTPEDAVLYTFRPGVRELLEADLLRLDIHKVLECVGAWIDQRLDGRSNFRAVLADPQSKESLRVPAAARRFALIQARGWRRIGGPLGEQRASTAESAVQLQAPRESAASSPSEWAAMVASELPANPFDLARWVDRLRPLGAIARTRLAAELQPDSSDPLAVTTTARAAALLVELGGSDAGWRVLRARANPTSRTELLLSCAEWKVSWRRLADRLLGSGPTDDERMALILALGRYDHHAFPEHDRLRRDLAVVLTRWYAEHPHPGVHGGIRWLFRARWSLADVVDRLDAELTTLDPPADARWYVGGPASLRQTFVVIHAPVEFWMGSPESDVDALPSERPQVPARLTRSFAIAIEPVTLERYESLMGRNRDGFRIDTDRPVQSVSWNQAVEFCNALSKQESRAPCYAIHGEEVEREEKGEGYRLPTEAEWEFACRAGTATRYGFGDDARRLSEFAWFFQTSKGNTHPVGTKLPNALGLFDTHGNVWEWCADGAKDWDEPFPLKGGYDPFVQWQGAACRVVRGGSWSYEARFCRSASRNAFQPALEGRNLGFRLAAVWSR